MNMNVKELTVECRLAHWAQVLRERTDSGESVDSFCLSRGIARNQYYYWQRKLREAVSEQLAGTEANHAQTGIVPRGFTEVKLSGMSGMAPHLDTSSNSSLCVELGGVRITAGRSYPASQIAELLKGIMPPW